MWDVEGVRKVLPVEVEIFQFSLTEDKESNVILCTAIGDGNGVEFGQEKADLKYSVGFCFTF